MKYFIPTKFTACLFLSAVMLCSCARKITTTTTPAAPKTIAIEEVEFDYLHGKARLNFKDDKKEREVKAIIRIRKDSVIWMNLTVVGVQGGRALINKDSVTILSTLNKEYYVYDYAELSRRFNFQINYQVIQAAMLGNLILPMTAQDNIQELPNYNLLEQQQGTVMVRNYINSVSRKLEKVELIESNTGNSIRVDYSNFQPVSAKTLPYTGVVSLSYRAATGLVNNTITFDYMKVEVGDKELKFPFNIPKRYERR